MAEAIKQAYSVGKKVAKDVEVIAIHGGRSKDKTWEALLQTKKKYVDLRLINKINNRQGYAVIKHGFLRATKDWVFYTDGDLQYDLQDLVKLVETQQKTGATVVNGYKVNRGDNVLRCWGGRTYARIAQLVFHLPIRDVDCDFRLIDNRLLSKILFESKNASILPELILKLHQAGGVFVEVPVSHSTRTYGHSNYRFVQLIKEKIWGDFRLWRRLGSIR